MVPADNEVQPRRAGLQIGPVEMCARGEINGIWPLAASGENNSKRLFKIVVNPDASIYITPMSVHGNQSIVVAKCDLNEIPETVEVNLSRRIPFYFDSRHWPKFTTKKVTKFTFHPDGQCHGGDHRIFRDPFINADHFSLLCNVFITELTDLPLVPFQEHQTSKKQIMPILVLEPEKGIVASIWVGPTHMPTPALEDRYGPLDKMIMDHRFDVSGIQFGRAPTNPRDGQSALSIIVCAGAPRRTIHHTGIFIAGNKPWSE